MLRAALTALVYVLALLPGTVFAQSSAISGVIRDPQQAVVPGAEVTLRNFRSAATPTVVSDGQGRYTFSALVPGSYTVEVYLSGFEVQASPVIALGDGQSRQHDFVLALAGATQSVTVTGSASPGYRVDTASIGSLASTSV